MKIRRTLLAANIQGSDLYAPYIPLTAIDGVNLYSLNNVVNATDFTNLFNEYCITGVKLSFNLRRMQQTSPTTSSCTIPTLYFNIDYDGRTIIPANLNAMLEKSTLQRRILEPGKPVTIWVKPRVSNLVYQSTLVNAYGVGRAEQWLSTDYPDAKHYGLAFAIDELRNTSNYVDITATYYMKFRGGQ